jgi:hypothetical protein
LQLLAAAAANPAITAMTARARTLDGGATVEQMETSAAATVAARLALSSSGADALMEAHNYLCAASDPQRKGFQWEVRPVSERSFLRIGGPSRLPKPVPKEEQYNPRVKRPGKVKRKKKGDGKGGVNNSAYRPMMVPETLGKRPPEMLGRMLLCSEDLAAVKVRTSPSFLSRIFGFAAADFSGFVSRLGQRGLMPMVGMSTTVCKHLLGTNMI